MEKIKAFLLFFDFEDQFRLLSREERGDLIMLLFRAAKEGGCDDIGEYPTCVQIAFSFMFAAIQRNMESYARTCQRRSDAAKNRESKKRLENGLL